MAEDVVYHHADFQRAKEIGGWIVGAIIAVMAATGWGFTLQRDVRDLQQAALVREGRISDIERGSNVTVTRLASVETKLDTLINLLQPSGATPTTRPSSAPGR